MLSTRLFDLLTDQAFPTPSSTGASSFASSFIKNAATTAGVSAQSGQRDPTKEVLNCLRVLQRVLPVVFEAEYEDFERMLLWKREEVQESGRDRQNDAVDDAPQFVIDDEDEDDDVSAEGPLRSPSNPGSGSQAPNPVQSSEGKKKTLPTLAERLISCTIDLLFCCGFTLPTKIQVDNDKVNYVIWYVR